MGPKARVTVEDAVGALKKHIKYFIPPKRPKWSSECWKIIANELGNKWDDNSVRTNVNNNRRQILTIALKECGYFTEEKNTESGICNEVENGNIDSSNSDEDDIDNDPDYVNHDSYFNDGDQIEEFDVEIRRELWNIIIQSIPDENKGQYFKLNKKVWTDIVAYAFWEQYRLKCAFMFKKGVICVSGNNYLTIRAYCKSKKCGNRLVGVIEDAPCEDGPVYIKIKCRDTRDVENHEDLQRPLQSARRKVIGSQLKDLGVHGYTRQAATKLLRPGETGCPFLHKPNVLHQAKKQVIDDERGIRPIDRKDIFAAIDRLNDNPIYRNSIEMVCKSPFFVFYTTQSQMHCYREYRRIHKKYSSICIDATGGVVRKIITAGEKSPYIFLYEIVINFNKTSQSVYQMLSAIQDADIITLWLKRWIRLGAKPPHEAVSDSARAQLNAMSSAFNDMSLKKYIKVCFENLKSKNLKTTDITTYIRLGVAHFVHSVTGWDCFKSVLHSSVKKFYIYCICLLIDSTKLDKLERILLLILIVCNVTYEDSIIDVNGEIITPLNAKSELEDLISCRDIPKFLLNVTNQIDKIEFDPEKTKSENVLSNTTENDSLSISTWMNDILKKSKNEVHQGNKLQSFFLPTLKKPLVEAVMEFPLWTNICIPHTDLRATSSYVEEDFKDLKMTLRRQISLPTDVYTFLKLHLDYLMGGVTLLRAKITKFIAESLNNTKKSHADSFNCDLSELPQGMNKNDSSENLMEEKENDSLSQLDQMKPVTSDIDDSLNKTSKSVDNIFDYNLSDVIEKKNKENPLEIWMGLGEDNKLNRYDWMKTETHNLDKAALNLNTDSDLIYIDNDNELFVDNYMPCNEINTNYDNKDNDNSKIEITTNHIKDYTRDIEIHNNYDESLSNPKIEYFEDHNYSLSTSTPLDNKRPKKTLSVAINEVARKKVKSGKYFNDCPEIKLVNNFVKSDTKSVKKKSYLLHNGHMSKAIHFDGCDWLLHQTCPFNTIIQLLFECTLQDTNFLEFCKNSGNSIFKFLIDFKKDGASDNIYEKRFKILYPIYKDTEKTQKRIEKQNYIATPISRTIFCADNINALWARLFADEPSIFEKNSCPTSKCDNNNNKNVAIFPINYTTIILRGFGSLQKALNYHSVIYNMRCGYCRGTKRICRQNPNFHIYIELDIKTTKEVDGRKYKLHELPIYLTLPITNEEDSSRDVRYRFVNYFDYSKMFLQFLINECIY